MSEPNTIIQNYQLMYAKYDIKTLEHNIDRLSLRSLLHLFSFQTPILHGKKIRKM